MVAERHPIDPSGGARPAPRLSVEEQDRLVELGVLGQVELVDGRVKSGRYPLAFSGEAIAAARAAGIELDRPADAPVRDGADPAR